MTPSFISGLSFPTVAAVFQILFINVVLGADNAIAIALACRSLSRRERHWGVVFGAGLGVLLRMFLISVIGWVLKIPFMHLVAGLLLMWIGIQLLVEDAGQKDAIGQTSLLRAVIAILIADCTMSLDNVLAIAGVAEAIPGAQRTVIVLLGIAAGAVVIAGASRIVLALLDRFPWISYLGAGLLGWVAISLICQDQVAGMLLRKVLPDTQGNFSIEDAVINALGVMGAIVTPFIGYVVALRQRRARQTKDAVSIRGEQIPAMTPMTDDHS